MNTVTLTFKCYDAAKQFGIEWTRYSRIGCSLSPKNADGCATLTLYNVTEEHKTWIKSKMAAIMADKPSPAPAASSVPAPAERQNLAGKTFISGRHAADVTWTVERYHRGGNWVCRESGHNTTMHFHESEIAKFLAGKCTSCEGAGFVIEGAQGEQHEAPCPTCDGMGVIGGPIGQTPESFEFRTEVCPDCSTPADSDTGTVEAPASPSWLPAPTGVSGQSIGTSPAEPVKVLGGEEIPNLMILPAGRSGFFECAFLAEEGTTWSAGGMMVETGGLIAEIRDDQLAPEIVRRFNSHAAHLAKIQALTEALENLVTDAETDCDADEEHAPKVTWENIESARAALSLPSA